jgi:OFA family oxalate/formate antiporter-like MFS transporter
MFFGSFVAKKYSPKLVIGCIGIMGPTFLWLSPLMPNYGLWWLFYLLVYALVNGLTYMSTIHHAWLWFPDKPGLASGIIMSGYGLSGFIFSDLSLLFVNP